MPKFYNKVKIFFEIDDRLLLNNASIIFTRLYVCTSFQSDKTEWIKIFDDVFSTLTKKQKSFRDTLVIGTSSEMMNLLQIFSKKIPKRHFWKITFLVLTWTNEMSVHKILPRIFLFSKLRTGWLKTFPV